MTDEERAAIEALLPRNSRTGEIEFPSLVDDLATVLVQVTVGWENVIGVDLAQHPSVVRVMARYRTYKANQPKPFEEPDAARESNRRFARAQEQRLLDEMRSPDA